MSLFSLINRGVKLSGGSQLDKALEAMRAQWLDRLCTDEIRAWMNVGTVDREALTAINFLFSAAAMCSIHDTRQIDSPDARVIRGALSALEQCGHAGCRITASHAAAFSSAATRAKEIFRTCSPAAIERAATIIHNSAKDIT